MALKLTPVIQKQVLQKYQLEFDYTLLSEIMMIVKKHDCMVIENEVLLFCRMKIGVPKEGELTCIEKLKSLNGLVVQPVKV